MDRQDIDALLIGALYGELAPADEARLAAHLESHPTDRSAFEALQSTREAVRDSRIFAVQVEPPQALSALLLQEAHRRAPREAKEREGWFQRLVRSFAAHPALAAAAMLVIVLGFAGVLEHRGAKVADRQLAESPASVPVATGQAAAAGHDQATAMPGAAEGSAAFEATMGSGYDVRLAEPADEAKNATRAEAQNQGHLAQQPTSHAAPVAHHEAPAPAKDKVARVSGKAAQGIVVTGNEPQPKDLDSMGPTGYASGERRTSTKAAAPAQGGDFAPPPPSMQAPQAVGTASIAADRPVAAGGAAAPTAAPAPVAPQSPQSPMLAWAKQRHAEAVAAAGRGDCAGAARISLAVEQRLPAYYEQVMATDRALAHCKQYIAAAIEKQKDAEAAKAATRVESADQKK